MAERIEWVEACGQRLGVVPRLGGGVAAWQWLAPDGALDLWRPWDGLRDDRYTLASFAMLPWSNRIGRGGFEQGGRWHAMSPNRDGEPYPIHGDGWLQRWRAVRPDAATIDLMLSSSRHGGGPYVYDAHQRFSLVEGGLDQTVQVTHRGPEPLPYGLGLHPWFPRRGSARVMARVDGVWLSGADPMPVRHTTRIPDSWDLAEDAPMRGGLIDNAYTGWDGRARLTWPEDGLAIDVSMRPLDTPRGPVAPHWCLVYRPPEGAAFCFEPITQPINAFHLPGRPGLVELAAGESITLSVRWRVHRAVRHDRR